MSTALEDAQVIGIVRMFGCKGINAADVAKLIDSTTVFARAILDLWASKGVLETLPKKSVRSDVYFRIKTRTVLAPMVYSTRH